jgi:hypothetical protein
VLAALHIWVDCLHRYPAKVLKRIEVAAAFAVKGFLASRKPFILLGAYIHFEDLYSSIFFKLE